MISFAGLSDTQVLLGLFNAAEVRRKAMLALSRMGRMAWCGEMTVAEADYLLHGNQARRAFRYLGGRAMHLELGEDCFDERGYDAANGSGAAQAVIDRLLAEAASGRLKTGPSVTEFDQVALDGWTLKHVGTQANPRVEIECSLHITGGPHDGLTVERVRLGGVGRHNSSFWFSLENTGLILLADDPLSATIASLLRDHEVVEQLGAFLTGGAVPDRWREDVTVPAAETTDIQREVKASAHNETVLVGGLPKRWKIDALLEVHEDGPRWRGLDAEACADLMHEVMAQDLVRLNGWYHRPASALRGYSPAVIVEDRRDPWLALWYMAQLVLSP